MDQFCPNCQFYMSNSQPDLCPKCGYRIKRTNPQVEEEVLQEYMESELKSADDDGNPVFKCPECQHRLRKRERQTLTFDLLGHDITTSTVSAFKMNLTKRAVTQVIVDFEGWACPKGHKYYQASNETVKQLCPICRGSMARFGSTVLSCKQCKINLTKDKYVYMKGSELMVDEGWTYHPEMFECIAPE